MVSNLFGDHFFMHFSGSLKNTCIAYCYKCIFTCIYKIKVILMSEHYNMYVYIITNKINNKQYIGSRKCYGNICDDNYMSSSKYLKKDIKKLGEENFTKEIVEENFNNIEDLLEAESKYILKYNTLSPIGYNKFLPNKRIGFHMNGHTHSKETKDKIRKSNTGKKHAPYKLSAETKEKIRLSRLGKPSNAKGKKWSAESRKKMSKIAKERTKEQNPMYGRKAWNTGLTKDTDERLKKIGAKIKIVKSKINQNK